MSLIKRLVKGSTLTHQEMDDNLDWLNDHDNQLNKENLTAHTQYSSTGHTHDYLPLTGDVNVTGAITATEFYGDGSNLTGIVSDHGELTGLDDNDHPQYSLSSHLHDNYSITGHNHLDYSLTSHNHSFDEITATAHNHDYLSLSGFETVDGDVTINADLTVTGNVGIGTATPTFNLHVKGSDVVRHYVESDTNGQASVDLKTAGSNNQHVRLINDDDHLLRIYDQGSPNYGNRFWIDNTGDSTVNANLTVTGSVTAASYYGDGSGLANIDHGNLVGLTGNDHPQYSLSSHLHTDYSLTSHDHNDIYYTETETNTKLEDYSQTSHTHSLNDITATAHDHNAIYYTESEINSMFNGYSASGHGHTNYSLTSHSHSLSDITATAHGHNDVYYTESEINSMFNGYSASGHGHTNYSLTSHTHSFDEITATAHDHAFSDITTTAHVHSFDEITATAHEHNSLYYTKPEIDLTLDDYSQTSHTHSLSDITATAHTHAFSDITATAHDHNDDYYTESEIDDLLDDITVGLNNYLSLSGFETVSGDVTINADLIVTGSATATSYYGDGSNLTGISSDHGNLTGLADDDHPQYSLSSHAHLDYSSSAHLHDNYSITGHNHDDDYYTETEINSKLLEYSTTAHLHDYLPLSGNASIENTVDFENLLTLSGEKVFTHDELKSINAGAKVEGYVDNENGTFTIAGASAHCYHTTDYTGSLYSHHGIVSSSTTYDLVDKETNYLIAGWDVTAGSTTAYMTTNVDLINESNIVPVITVYRDGNLTCGLEWDKLCLALPNRLHARFVKTRRFERSEGLFLETNGIPLQFEISNGVVWYGAMTSALNAIDSTTTSASLYYHSSGVWEETTITGYNNTQYDDGTNLQSTGNNHYCVNWIYRNVSSSRTDEHTTHVILGTENYTLSDALNAQPPTDLPGVLTEISILVGRIVVEKDATSAENVDSAFDLTFSQSSITDHGNLTGLDDNDHPQYSLSSHSHLDYSLTSHNHSFDEITATAHNHDYLSLSGFETVDGDVTINADLTVTGNVGIGTSNPTFNLHVKGSDGVRHYVESDTDGQASVDLKTAGSNNQHVRLINDDDHLLRIYDQGSPNYGSRFWIDNTGDSTVNANLTVTGSVTAASYYGDGSGLANINHGNLVGLAGNDHPQYSLSSHLHDNYSITGHNHIDYSLTSHSHDYLSLTGDEEVTGSITATSFYGVGTNLTNIDHGNLTGLGDNDHPQYGLTAGADFATFSNTGNTSTLPIYTIQRTNTTEADIPVISTVVTTDYKSYESDLQDYTWQAPAYGSNYYTGNYTNIDFSGVTVNSMHLGGFYGNMLITETPGIRFHYASGLQEPVDCAQYIKSTANGGGGAGSIIKCTGDEGTVQRDVTKSAVKAIFSEGKNTDPDGNAVGYFGYGWTSGAGDGTLIGVCGRAYGASDSAQTKVGLFGISRMSNTPTSGDWSIFGSHGHGGLHGGSMFITDLNSSDLYHPYYQTTNHAPSYINHTDTGSLYVENDIEIGGILYTNSVQRDWASVVANTTITDGHIFLVQTSAAALTVTLPGLESGREIVIKDKSGNANTYNISIATPGAERIDGSASDATINTDYGSMTLVCDSSNWYILG